MSVFRRLFVVAALAGLIAGIFVTVVHQFTTVPVILHAETFEQAADMATHDLDTTSQTGAADGTDYATHDDEWAPADGLQRTLTTGLADVLTGIGFALLLVCAYAIRGERLDWRKGLYWGLGGFVAVTLAPSLGLPPELPGTEAAPLVARQVWWLATVVLTGGGLALIVFSGKRLLPALAGVALIVLPHIYGAPQPAEHVSLAPADLTHRFIVAAIVTGLLFWIALGSLTGFFYDRVVSRAA